MSDTPAPVTLEKSEQNLIWLDCEMTGLDPERDRLLEIAVVVTGPQLSPLVEHPALVIHQSEAQLALMDNWNQSTHNGSGLIARVRATTMNEDQAQEALLSFLALYCPKGCSPMCGNTVGQDRRFLAKYMPKLESFFHYRNLDVSTLKELAKRWQPSIYSGFKKAQKHTAMADVLESIEELKYYREHFLRV